MQPIRVALPTAPVLAGAVACLSDLNRTQLRQWTEEHGLPQYRGEQLWRALAVRGTQHIGELTELPAGLRRQLQGQCRFRSLTAVTHLTSGRDASEKVLLGLAGGGTIEAVLIPGRGSTGRSRLTVCVSSQVGCPAACTFCATGLSGFGRNLSPAEISDQVMYFAGRLRERGERVSNVVFMGMGEPLLNTRSVRLAIDRLTDPDGFNLGERSITVSTVGIVPQIRAFAEWGGQVNLAVSLHAPNDELRSQLVPYNRHFPIAELLDAVRFYLERTRRRVSFEYVLLSGTNDDCVLATQLARLLLPFGSSAHVNLIPWNPFQEGKFIRSEGPDAVAFATALRRAGVNATIRYSKGLDISAACGQLREQSASTD